TLDYQDAFSKGYERMVKRASILMKLPVKMEWKRLEKYEHDVFDNFEHKLIVSEQDQKLIPHPGRGKMLIVPVGVDFDYWSPQRQEKKYDLIFSGHMNYPPNIESALFIANEVMPLLLKKKPDARLVLAGANPSKEIQRLQGSHMQVTGFVDDIRPY